MKYNDLQPPKYINTLNYSEAQNSDIISTINANFEKALQQTKTFSKRFAAGTAQATAYNVWKFLRQNIVYKKDSDAGQLVRLPTRFIADGVGDCQQAPIFRNRGNKMKKLFTHSSFHTCKPWLSCSLSLRKLFRKYNTIARLCSY